MPIVRLDKIAGTHIENVRNDADVMLNGFFVQPVALVEGETSLYVAGAPTDVADEVWMHVSPEVESDPRRQGLTVFEVPVGTAARAYHMTVGDVISMTRDLVTGAPAVGSFLIPAVGAYRLAVAADEIAADASRFSAVVIEDDITLGYNNEAAIAFRVISV